MPSDWYYVVDGKRMGPISSSSLKAMAARGSLSPDDRVWKAGMDDWVAAKSVRGLISKPGPAASDHSSSQDASIPRPSSGLVTEGFKPRLFLAGCGGFLAALGMAFTVIRPSSLGLAFTVGGLSLAATGLYVEIGLLVRQAAGNLGTVFRQSTERRQRAKEMDIEKRRLALEEQKLRSPQSSTSYASTTDVSGEGSSGPVGGTHAPAGNTVIISHPPVQKWSPGLAAVLSFFIPGLGQIYKGQVINGIVWFIVVPFGYLALVLPGLLLHLFCVLGAMSGNPWTEGKTSIVRQ